MTVFHVYPNPCYNQVCFKETAAYMSRNLIFPTMWYLRPAKSQISLRIRAV